MRRLYWKSLLALGVAVLTGIGVGIGVIWAELPQINSLADYAPAQSSKVYSADGALVGAFASERRTVVPFACMTPHLVHAFLAAEDANFYQHEGIDYLGILRAVIKNMRPGAHLQGASTITQQTVKTLILGPERSYLRKIREALLARQMEQMLHKEEILTLYLNQIYFGNGALGIAEASRTYFGKAVDKLDLAEAALLAAAVKNPAHYNIRADAVAAKARQRYVLEQMLAHHWATAEAVQAAMAQAAPYPAEPPPFFNRAPYYLEHVRRTLVERFGEARLYQGGLRITLAMDAHKQAAAQTALRQGLEDVARRLGHAAPTFRLQPAALPTTLRMLRQTLQARLAKLQTYRDAPQAAHGFVWSLGAPALGADQTYADGAQVARTLEIVPLQTLQRIYTPVVGFDAATLGATVDLGSHVAVLPLTQMAFVRTGSRAPVRNASEVLALGDVIEVEVTHLPQTPKPQQKGRPKVAQTWVSLVPTLQVQGALVAIAPHSHEVQAMVGGIPADVNGFNRATQALRQPGSAFKPILYATGLQQKVITPASLCADGPVVVPDPWTHKLWRPDNYESGQYDGNITYRRALMRSKNTCSVRLLQKLTPQPCIAMAHALGLTSKMPENLTLALGTGDTTVLDLTNAYASIAAGGLFRPPVFIRRVHDALGAVLWDAQQTTVAPVAVLSHAEAYVLTNMMQSVIQGGTGSRAQVLQRPLAGKTGTSQQSRNLWFSGFAPQLCASVWMGYDSNAPVGNLTGASAALPAWIRFMGMALAGEEAADFVRPAEVKVARIDPNTGSLSEGPDSIEEVFVPGTEPTEAAQALPSIYLQE
jgi:penicillin-binding protein 1A